MGVRLREKKPGEWWVVTWHRGRRTSKRVGAKREAESLAKELRAALARRDYDLPSRGAPTVGACVEEFLRTAAVLRSLKPSTVENYGSFLRQHVVPVLGALPVTGITAERLEEFILTKRESGSVRFQGKGLAAASLRTGLTAFRLVLQKAVRAKHLASNPFSDLDTMLPRRTDETTIDPFTAAEVRSLLAAAETMDPAWRTLLEVWARTGARAGEIAALQAQDWDAARGVMLIQRTWTRGRLGTPKTGMARAVSVLHPTVEDSAAWQPGSTAESRELLARLGRLPVRLDPRAYLFGDGQQPLDSAVIHRLWKRTLQRARVRYRAPEQFRHTFASTMLSRNAPPLYVQQQGGWRSASVLFRVYARWMPQEVPALPISAPQRTERPEPTAPQARPVPGSSVG